jgi:MFS transporter, FHS family, L-fucose permease
MAKFPWQGKNRGAEFSLFSGSPTPTPAVFSGQAGILNENYTEWSGLIYGLGFIVGSVTAIVDGNGILEYLGMAPLFDKAEIPELNSLQFNAKLPGLDDLNTDGCAVSCRPDLPQAIADAGDCLPSPPQKEPRRQTDTAIVAPENLFAFILVTACFGLWGMVNMMTDTLVPAVQKIFSIDTAQSSLIQVVNYASYALLSFPAAVLVKRFNYKTGVILGLLFLCIGASAVVPAGASKIFSPLLLAISVLACGLSILETSCNPYVIAMGAQETAVRRLNLAQTINPVGCLLGLFVARVLILGNLNPAEADLRKTWDAATAHNVMSHELFWLAIPYAVVVIVTILMITTLFVKRMPEGRDTEHSPPVGVSVRRLLANPRYTSGVIAQFFYVGLQVAVWTFVIKYTRQAAIFSVAPDGNIIPGMVEADAWYSLMASMVVFTIARMVCTALMRKFNPASMMSILAAAGILLTIAAICLPGWAGVVCLVLVSACMSLMFPTIYGIALRDLGPEVKLGASGLIMAILGGAVGSYSQAFLIDLLEETLRFRTDLAIRCSFIIPIICFMVVLSYAMKYRAFCADNRVCRHPSGA